MWHAIQAYHDLPTASWYSPHQIQFWRDRIEQGLPWATSGKALVCEDFLANAEETAAKVTQALTKEHEKRRHHQETGPVAKYKVGDTVWLERPSKLCEHRQATYYAPAEVQKQLGEDTYSPKVRERLCRDRYHSKMKLRVSDPRGRHVQFDYANLEVGDDDPFTEEHEYNALEIVGYRPAPDVPGEYEFKTQWEGFGQTHDSWEPGLAFVPRYTQCFVAFLKRRKKDLKVTALCGPKKA